MSGEWKRTSRANPCPICGKPDWCSISADGAVCHCMRSESDHACASGGWFHFLVERPRREFRPRFVPTAPARPKLFDAAKTMAGFRAEFEGDGIKRDIFDSLQEIAADLDMPAAAIDRLGVGRSAFHNAWAFPMRDGQGNVVGIRLREYGTSRKWSVAGSRDGLFYDPSLAPGESYANGVRGREIVAVEGATDCAAGYALGLPCVGRSSCGTGADALLVLCARLKVQRVTIVSDNDGYKERPDGSVFKPGLDGARTLGAKLKRTFRIVVPPKKDLRDWLAAGLTAGTFWMVADLQPWRVK